MAGGSPRARVPQTSRSQVLISEIESDMDAIDELIQALRTDRRSRGIEHPRAKLDDDKVRTIREAARRGASAYALGLHFGVATATVRAALNRTTWKHVE